MRILSVFGEDYPWDVRLHKLLSGFRADGHEIYLVCRNLARRPRSEITDGLHCRRVTSPRLPKWVNAAVSIPAFFNPVWTTTITRSLREARADVVFVRDLPLAAAALRAAGSAGLPLLLDMAENHPAMWEMINGLYPWRLGSRMMKNAAIGRMAERHVARRADMILCVTPDMREHLIGIGASPDRVRVVSNTLI